MIEFLESRTLLSAIAGKFDLSTPALPDVTKDSAKPTPVGVISLSATTVSPIRVDLSWRTMGTTGSSTLTIERATGAGAFSPIATISSSARSWQSTNLVSDTTYRYRLRAGATLSNEASATTQKYDAGLNGPFLSPSAVTGQTRNILSYGATPNNSSNDDTTAIKNAIAASSAGDEIYIPNGVYHLKTRDIRLKTGVSIRGQSQSGVILSALFSDQGSENPNSQIFNATPGVGNFTVSNLTINMAGGQALQYGFYLGSGSSGSNCSRIAVKDVTIEGFEKFAIAARNCDNVLVQGCTIRNATALGGGGQGYAVMLGYSNTRNCWVTQNYFGPVLRHAVVIQYEAHHNLIENNVADGCTLDAYDLHGEDEYSNELRFNIAKNTSGGYGFGAGNTGSTHINSGPNNWIHHNEVFNSRGGINIMLGSDRQIVEDNYFHDNEREGILVNNGGGANLWFLRNTCIGNAKGADISSAPDLWFEGNTLTGNSGASLITDSLTINYTIMSNDFRFNGSGVLLGSELGIFFDNLG